MCADAGRVYWSKRPWKSRPRKSRRRKSRPRRRMRRRRSLSRLWRRPRKLSALKSHNARQGSQGRATSSANMRHRLGHHRPGWGHQRSQRQACQCRLKSHHRLRRRRARRPSPSPAPFNLRRHPLTQFRPHRRNGPPSSGRASAQPPTAGSSEGRKAGARAPGRAAAYGGWSWIANGAMLA